MIVPASHWKLSNREIFGIFSALVCDPDFDHV